MLGYYFKVDTIFVARTYQWDRQIIDADLTSPELIAAPINETNLYKDSTQAAV